jgi:hypothetical protein
LAWKSSFAALMRELGYRAPLTIVVPAGCARAAVSGALSRAFPADAALFCKPLDGFQGRGARECRDRDEAADFLAGRREAYLAQSLERPIEDWRYVLHRDRDWVEQAGGGRSWRIAYKKVRPSVHGDGRSTLAELVRRDTTMPDGARRKLLRCLGAARLAGVPAAGECVTLAATGNVSQGAYGCRPTPAELGALDAFMQRVQADLDAHLGAPLATSCFDLGLTEAGALDAPCDVERLRRAVVFYEFQFPFGLSGYRATLSAPPARGAARLLPAPVWGALWRHALVWRFFASVTHSGRARRPAPGRPPAAA